MGSTNSSLLVLKTIKYLVFTRNKILCEISKESKRNVRNMIKRRFSKFCPFIYIYILGLFEPLIEIILEISLSSNTVMGEGHRVERIQGREDTG